MTRQYDLDIQYFLAACLRLIAYINNSSIPGITIDTIRKIDKTLNNKKQSLLQTVVVSFLRSSSKRLSFVDRYPNLGKIARLDMKDMDRSKQDLSTALKAVESDVEAIAAQRDTDASIEAFVTHMQQFIASSRGKLDEMNTEYDKMLNNTNRCLQFFGATQIDGFVASFTYMVGSVKRYVQLEAQKDSIKQTLRPLTPLNSHQPSASSRGHPAADKKPGRTESL